MSSFPERTAAGSADNDDCIEINTKIICGSDIRRISLQSATTFDALQGQMQAKFGLRDQAFCIMYSDDDGDRLSITDDDELRCAIAYAQTRELRLEIFSGHVTSEPRQLPVPASCTNFDFNFGALPCHATVAQPEPADGNTFGGEFDFGFGGGFDFGTGDATAPSPAPPHNRCLRLAENLVQAGCGMARGGPHSRCRGHRSRYGRRGWHSTEDTALRGFGKGRGWRGGGKHPCKSRFVCDLTLPDSSFLSPGEKVTKIWRLHNNGTIPWPEGTTLLHVAGDIVQANPGPIKVSPAHPGSEADIAVDIIAPSLPGRYVSYFRLQGPRGRRFGQRIWVMFTVAAGQECDDGDVCDHAALCKATEVQELEAKAEKCATKAATIAASAQGNPRALKKAARLQARSETFAAKASALTSLDSMLQSIPEMASLTSSQQQTLVASQLSMAQVRQVCEAIAANRHLGVICDVSGKAPIVGVRFTKPNGHDTYDVSEEVFGALPTAEQEMFEAVPVPDIDLVIRTVVKQGQGEGIETTSQPAEAVPPDMPDQTQALKSPDGGGSESEDFELAGDELLDTGLGQIAAMGFSPTSSATLEALRAADGNVSAAIEILLAQSNP